MVACSDLGGDYQAVFDQSDRGGMMRVIRFLIVWAILIFVWHLGTNLGERAFIWVIENFTDIEITKGINWLFTALVIGGLTAFVSRSITEK